jgi:hypothetical protein
MHQPLVEIKKPCHEILDARRPGEKDRFCSSCQTVVIDFTTKTPEEIRSYFLTHKHEVICGNFKSEDVKTDSTADRLMTFLHSRKMKFLALVIFGILVITGCKTRKHGSTYGGPRLLDGHNPSIENLN